MSHFYIKYTFFYRKMGAGPAVILIHGFPECSTLWRNIWDDLAKKYTLIIPDLPGTGGTPLTGSITIPEMAEGIKLIMDKEGIDRAIIAGHSMGGYISFAFADLFPGRVAGLVLVHSTPAADDAEKKNLRLRSIELVKNGGKDVFLENMVPNLFSPAFKQSHPAIVKDLIDEALKMNTESIVNFYTAMMEREDTSAVLRSADFPVQWVIGLDDNLLPYKKILAFCHTSPVNFVTFYRNCGHMSMLEVPDQLAADMDSFINYTYNLSLGRDE